MKQTNKRLIMVVQGKGGVGRSTCAAMLVDWLRSGRGPRLAVFEVGARTPLLGAVYGPDGSAPLEAPDVFCTIDWCDSRTAACNTDAVLRCLGLDALTVVDIAVLDARAGATEWLLEWLRDADLVSAARNAGIGVTVAVVVDATAVAAKEVVRFAEALDPAADLLVVRNTRGRARVPWDVLRPQVCQMRPSLQEIRIPNFGNLVSAHIEDLALLGSRITLLGATTSRTEAVRQRAVRCWSQVVAAFARQGRFLGV